VARLGDVFAPVLGGEQSLAQAQRRLDKLTSAAG
jgi:hypothetical protein